MGLNDKVKPFQKEVLTNLPCWNFVVGSSQSCHFEISLSHIWDNHHFQHFKVFEIFVWKFYGLFNNEIEAKLQYLWVGFGNKQAILDGNIFEVQILFMGGTSFNFIPFTQNE